MVKGSEPAITTRLMRLTHTCYIQTQRSHYQPSFFRHKQAQLNRTRWITHHPSAGMKSVCSEQTDRSSVSSHWHSEQDNLCEICLPWWKEFIRFLKCSTLNFSICCGAIKNPAESNGTLEMIQLLFPPFLLSYSELRVEKNNNSLFLKGRCHCTRV